jgi:putative endonuclease
MMSDALNKSWFVYILLCNDGTLYTGIARDVQERFLKHQSGKGARYTRARGAKEIIFFQKFPNRSEAARRESQIKKLNRVQKIKLATSQIQ